VEIPLLPTWSLEISVIEERLFQFKTRILKINLPCLMEVEVITATAKAKFSLFHLLTKTNSTLEARSLQILGRRAS